MIALRFAEERIHLMAEQIRKRAEIDAQYK